MRTLRVAAATLVAALALTACDGGDDPDDTVTPPATGTTSGTTTTPTSPVPAAAPTLPPAATRATEAGARAFIAYYWDLINYAQVTGEVKALRRNAARTCTACSDLADRIGDQYAGGGSIVGGTNAVTITKATEVTTESGSAFGYRIAIDVSHDGQTLVHPDGADDVRRPGTNAFTAFLMWTDQGRWRLDVLELT